MRILLAIMLGFLSSFISANEEVNDPNQVIHLVSSNTFSRINTEKNKLQAQPSYIKIIIEEELIPYFDYKYASYKVMGSHLKNTTKEQRVTFVEAFKGYLINAYSHILLGYDQQEFEILDNNHYKGKKVISIPVRIRDKNDQTTQVAFKLRKNKKTGQWKVFDVLAEGISMLNTKQAEFGELFHKQGVDHVIELLQAKNNEL